MISRIALLLGIYVIAKVFFPIYKHIYSFYKNKEVWKNLKNRWILITDSTTELGNEFCFQLAKKKHNLIITDKDEMKLAKQKLELEKMTNVIAYRINLENCTNFDFLEQHDIGLMINKIGFFESSSVDYGNFDVEGIFDKHLIGSILLTKSILSNMNKKGSGHIVNIGLQFINLIPGTYFPICSSITSALKSFSENMNYDYFNSKISVEFMNVGFLSLKRNGLKPSFFSPSVEKFTSFVLRTVGCSGKTVPYAPHLILYLFIKLTPIFVLGRIYKGYINECLNK